jgi:tyrosyl-tRNA synthetase
MILQAHDFLELYRRYHATLHLSGSDQWGNMVSGTKLGRRCESVQLFALTAPLIYHIKWDENAQNSRWYYLVECRQSIGLRLLAILEESIRQGCTFRRY